MDDQNDNTHSKTEISKKSERTKKQAEKETSPAA